MPVARVPPVVPPAGLDDRRLAFAQDARPPVELQRQLAFEHREALDDRGVEVLADDPGPGERGQLGGGSPLGVVGRELEDRAALPGDGVLPDLASPDRREVRRPARIGVRHAFRL